MGQNGFNHPGGNAWLGHEAMQNTLSILDRPRSLLLAIRILKKTNRYSQFDSASQLLSLHPHNINRCEMINGGLHDNLPQRHVSNDARYSYHQRLHSDEVMPQKFLGSFART